MKIAVGGIKGGGGKTTAATSLVIMRRTAGVDALLVDADDGQRSAAEFADQRAQMGRPPIPCIELSGRAVRDQVLQLGERYADVIVDTGGRDTLSQRAALTVADLVLLPFQPGNFDLWTLERVEGLLTEVRTVNPSLRALAYISRGLPAGPDNESAREMLRQSTAVELLDVTLGNRKAFNTAAGEGIAVTEMAKKDPKAVAELTALYHGIFGKTEP